MFAERSTVPSVLRRRRFGYDYGMLLELQKSSEGSAIYISTCVFVDIQFTGNGILGLADFNMTSQILTRLTAKWKGRVRVGVPCPARRDRPVKDKAGGRGCTRRERERVGIIRQVGNRVCEANAQIKHLPTIAAAALAGI